MLSVIIPTLNNEATLTRALAPLVPAAIKGLVREVVVADGGSADGTLAIVEAAGAKLVRAARGRGSQLAAGAMAARSDWLLFLHPDTVLQTGWECEVEKLFEQIEAGRFRSSELAASFRFALDDFSAWARFIERVMALRCWLFRLPYGEQGLLVNGRLYKRLGGHHPLPLMEDVDLGRRIRRHVGRGHVVFFRTQAVTSPARYIRDGFVPRMFCNLLCITLYHCRVPVRFLVRLYR